MDFLELLHLEFMLKALLAGSLIAISCALLGLFLVLKRYSLIGDGLSHVAFGGIAIGLLLKTSPVYTALPVVLLSAYGILKLKEKTRIHGDTAIGIVSAAGLAGGILLISTVSGFNVDLFGFLFGNILLVNISEIIISGALSLIIIMLIFFYYHDLFLITFDEESARVSGINVERLNILLVLLTAVTVVMAVRVVGILLVTSQLILPASTALQLGKNFRSTIVISVISALSGVTGGIIASYLLDTPSGATIVLMNFIFFLGVVIYRNWLSPFLMKLKEVD